MAAFATGFDVTSTPLSAWPPAPGVAWHNPTHTTVITASGARYDFRDHSQGGGKVYVSDFGSSSGEYFTNVVLDEMPAIAVGKRMVLDIGGSWARVTTPVVGWERTDIMTSYTSTWVDDIPGGWDEPPYRDDPRS